MSKRAEEKALEVYPVRVEWVGNQYGGPEDVNYLSREKYQEGYEQAEKDLGWISVNERLPKPHEWVLACKRWGNTPTLLTLATYDETNGWHTDDWDNGEQEVYIPEYWMQIPDFKEEER